ncbi:hypothetical protein [Streptomyces sp. NPDC051909]|uniref:hypothetical protein n=1 Tax=Streptomyces sp. NPDC051909 TaxID=3154944 RepID=UPI00342B7A26
MPTPTSPAPTSPSLPSLARLAPAAGRLTVGLELPLDNDWGVERGRAGPSVSPT